MTTPSRTLSARGAMTAVMASAASLPRALRVALLRDGRVVDERTFPRGTSVTAGTREDCLVVLADPDAPAHHVLFAPVGDSYELRPLPTMRGRIATDGAPGDLRGVPVALGRDGRGKVSFGATTVLFQMTAQAPTAVRSKLPESVKSGFFKNLDWPVTVIAAFSFLFHFGAVGSLYTDWNDTILPDQNAVVSLVHQVTTPKTPVEPAPDPTETQDPNPTHDPDPKPGPKPSPNPSPGPVAHNQPINAAAIGAALDRLNNGVLASVGTTGPSTQSVLDPKAPMGNLDNLGKNPAGMTPSTALNLGVPGGPVGPGQHTDLGSAIALQGKTGTNGTPTSVDNPTVPTGPKPPAGPAPGPAPDDAQKVLGMARIKARQCFNQGLNENAEMEGRVSYSLSLSGEGSVLGVSASPSGNLSPGVTNCIRSALQGLHFDGKGQPTTLTGSFNLVNPNKKH